MKNKLLYILSIAALFAVIYLLEANRKPIFSWESSYHHSDKQPFGSYVFDSVVRASVLHPYQYSNQTIYQLLHEDSVKQANLLIAKDILYLEKEEVIDLLNYISAGNTVLLASERWNDRLLDTLLLEMDYNYYDVVSALTIKKASCVIRFTADSVIYHIPRVLACYDLHPKETLNHNDSITLQQPHIPATVLANNDRNGAVLLKYSFGKGNLLLCTLPKLFTNYGVLDTLNNGFVGRTLGHLQGQSIVRLEERNNSYTTGSQQSPLRYILSHRALRWGLYVLMVAMLLFFVFTAKRKQRPIPVIKKPVNNLQQFAYSIASLYLHRNNNADLILKKYVYWADRLKRMHGIDIINEAHTREFIARFAAKTNQPLDACTNLFRQLDAIDTNSHVSDDEMKDLITRINNIN